MPEPTEAETGAEKIRDINHALLTLQADPPVLTKQKSGQVGNQKTKYADLPAVNTQVLTRLNALGVIWRCAPTLLADTAQGPGRFVLQYQLLHVASGTHISGDYPLGAGEPQKMGSAITYARRYALLAVTGIAAEDDDDDGAGGATPATRRARPAAADKPAPSRARPASSPAPAPAPASEQRARAGAAVPFDSAKAQREMFALFRDMDLGGKDDRETRLILVSNMLGREVTTVNDLNQVEVVGVNDALRKASKLPEPRTAAIEIYQRTSGGTAAPVAEPPKAAAARGRRPAETRTVAQQTHDSIVGKPSDDPADRAPWDVEEPAGGDR